MDEIRAGLRYLFQTASNYTLLASGTGHAGMEMAIANLVEPGDRVLVGVNGIWGARVADMAERFGAQVVELAVEPGGPQLGVAAGRRGCQLLCSLLGGKLSWPGRATAGVLGRGPHGSLWSTWPPPSHSPLLPCGAGKSFSLAQLTAAVERHKPALLFLTQGESSTGVRQSLAG